MNTLVIKKKGNISFLKCIIQFLDHFLLYKIHQSKVNKGLKHLIIIKKGFLGKFNKIKLKRTKKQ